MLVCYDTQNLICTILFVYYITLFYITILHYYFTSLFITKNKNDYNEDII